MEAAIHKHFWFWIIIILAVAVMTAVAFFYRVQPTVAPGTEKEATQGTAAENLENANRALEEAVRVEVPSANPLDEALPDVNPIEAANPFRKGYQNPFSR